MSFLLHWRTGLTRIASMNLIVTASAALIRLND